MEVVKQVGVQCGLLCCLGRGVLLDLPNGVLTQGRACCSGTLLIIIIIIIMIIIIIDCFLYSAFLDTQRRFTKRNTYRHSDKRQINNTTTIDNTLRERERAWKMVFQTL